MAILIPSSPTDPVPAECLFPSVQQVKVIFASVPKKFAPRVDGGVHQPKYRFGMFQGWAKYELFVRFGDRGIMKMMVVSCSWRGQASSMFLSSPYSLVGGDRKMMSLTRVGAEYEISAFLKTMTKLAELWSPLMETLVAADFSVYDAMDLALAAGRTE